MKVDLNKIEFDINEFGALLLQDKQERFRQIGEKFLNAVLENEVYYFEDDLVDSRVFKGGFVYLFYAFPSGRWERVN